MSTSSAPTGRGPRPAILTALLASVLAFQGTHAATFRDSDAILSDPYLNLPTVDGVTVAWFTEGTTDQSFVRVGDTLDQTFPATSTRMTRMYEDGNSEPSSSFQEREIWRHEATVTGLTAGVRTPYQAVSVIDSITYESGVFSLQPLPSAGQPMKIVLTSDQQNREMYPATIEALLSVEPDIDGVFFAGDFVDVPQRASEWFDRRSNSRPAFFPSIQGFYKTMRDNRWPSLGSSTNPYEGGPLLQNAWLFGTIGNHESPGLWRPGTWNLNTIDVRPQPRWYAEIRYEKDKATINPTDDPAIRAQWIQDNSFNFTQYLEMWNHPDTSPGGETYYAYRIGDVFVISMHVNRVYRSWNFGWPKFDFAPGKLGEPGGQLNSPVFNWGFGDMFFERFAVGTDQYNWLVSVLASSDFQTAKYRVVLAHQTGFGLGENSVPVMAEPVATIDYNDGGGTSQLQVTYPMTQTEWENTIEPLLGSITGITYDYPLADDVWNRDIEPLLLQNDVHLVHFGHSHAWNRSRVEGLNYIETSNYGNTFGVGWQDTANGIDIERAGFADFPQDRADSNRFDLTAYPRYGDPQGRPAIFPNETNPEVDFGEQSVDVPFVSSNSVGVFTVLDTGTGTVRSYAYDWQRNGSSGAPVLFDEFPLDVPSPVIKSVVLEAGDMCFTYERLEETALSYSYEGRADLITGDWATLSEGVDYTETIESDLGAGKVLVKVCLNRPEARYYVQVLTDGL